jgi:hypothetical protein
MLPRAEPKDWEEVLPLLHFPASLSEIVKSALDIGGIDSEVHEVIGRLPRDTYDTLDEFVHDIREIYKSNGIAEDKLPL